MLWYMLQRLTLPAALSAAHAAADVASQVHCFGVVPSQVLTPHCQSSVTQPHRCLGAKPAGSVDMSAVELIVDQSGSHCGSGQGSPFSMQLGDEGIGGSGC
jgi:hypothetical protein